MAAHDGFGLVDDVPTENKKGARMEAVLRPSQALLANNKQDITGADNHYTI